MQRKETINKIGYGKHYNGECYYLMVTLTDIDFEFNIFQAIFPNFGSSFLWLYLWVDFAEKNFI